jgi:riboflavin kinase/FMN adenylyltransferase
MAPLDLFAETTVRGPSAVALGTFDGVHLGHQHLIAELVKEARRLGGPAVVVTFQPRPIEVLRPGAPSLYLCTLDRRVQRLTEAGADVVETVRFTPELSRVSAEDFARSLVEKLGMRTLVGGPDLAFGHRREGTGETLRQIARREGFAVHEVAPIEVRNEIVRTSTVQRVLASGDIARAATLLGRAYDVEGTVVHGAGRGRELGVPTANLAVPANIVLPSNGIYAARCRVDDQVFNGAASLGTDPTFGENPRNLEVHLLDFHGDLYHKAVDVEFVAYLRPEERFDSIEALIRQMNADIRLCREILAC